MPIPIAEAQALLLESLNEQQREAVAAPQRKLLVVAGAGSGKTEVMARRVAWWIAVEGVEKASIIAFTFTDSAAEELKFRIRNWLQRVSRPDEDPTLGGMYVGTMHGFCLKVLRELAADDYYVFDVLDEAGRMSLVEQGFNNILALRAFQQQAEGLGAATGKFDTLQLFLRGYDLLNEYGLLRVQLPADPAPFDVREEREWCLQAQLLTNVGATPLAQAFAVSVARYYAYLRARRFLDFSTVQSELASRLGDDPEFAERVRGQWNRLVVDEVQDINRVQFDLIRAIIGEEGHLTAVGDHRQAIYSFRGGRIDLMGELFREIDAGPEGRIIELALNYRSTPRIIELSNGWSTTIADRAGMTNPPMQHGRNGRTDFDAHHIALIQFPIRDDEATWIAATISGLVQVNANHRIGARHDEADQSRGLTFSDIAILVRTGTDIRTYQDALRAVGVPAVVRGGADLFSQPEVLLFLAAFALCGDVVQFFGNPNRAGSLPHRIQRILNSAPQADNAIRAAVQVLTRRGLIVAADAADRLIRLATAIRERTSNEGALQFDLRDIRCADAVEWLTRNRNRQPRRVFPQTIFHWLLHEGGIQDWGNAHNQAQAEAARFHVGQLSTLIKGMETSGWTPPGSLKWQTVALLSWGSTSARIPQAPLLVSPNAVTITTIHSAKGLEFPAVFVADVCPRRFPNSRARTAVTLPYDRLARPDIDPTLLADNPNYDNERRLMYVALTRAERYLFVTYSGPAQSSFVRELRPLFAQVGGTTNAGGFDMRPYLAFHPGAHRRDERLATSFSDLRYYLECPHDFYLRKVLGFTPAIGQEFGYGRGIHNLLRAVHSDPRRWAELAGDPPALAAEIRSLIDRGLFYLRYTTADPLANLQNKAIEGVAEYVRAYSAELEQLNFEPEREFETLLDDGSLLVSGAIDLIRLDDPPRVTIIDFKSGDAEDATGTGLSAELMEVQIGVYGLAARHELEYDPQRGLVRYIGERNPERRELQVDLDDAELVEVRRNVVETGARIRRRDFAGGPTRMAQGRCRRCDFKLTCPHEEARRFRVGR